MRRQVLITCGGGLQGHTLIRDLRGIGALAIHVVDSNAESPGRYFADHYAVGPPVAERARYRDFLREYVGANAIELLLPATPHDLELLAALRDDLEAEFGCRVAVSDPGLLDILLHKRRAHQWLTRHGFDTLEEIAVADIGDRLPVIGKRNDQWGGQGAIVMTERSQLDRQRDLEAYLWTPWLAAFDEYSVDFCIDFSGRASAPLVRQRLATVGGFAVVTAEARFPPPVQAQLEGLVEALAGQGGRGPFNVQWLRDARGQYHVSDINPRIGTSAVVAARLGASLCAPLVGEEIVPPRPARGLKVVRHLAEAIVESRDLGQVKAIVFDLDDTLISHKDWILAKVDHVAGRYLGDRRRRFVDAAAMHIDEGKAPRLYDCLCEDFGLADIRDELIAAHRAFIPAAARVYDDVEAMLARLGGCYQLGLLSDNPAASQRQKLDRFPFTDRFEAIVLTDELGRSKPDREVFDAMARALGRDAEELVMVGDNFHRDIGGALDAGYACGFQIERGDRLFNSSSRLSRAEDFVVISSLRELGWYL